jgi:hypothetical protein
MRDERGDKCKETMHFDLKCPAPFFERGFSEVKLFDQRACRPDQRVDASMRSDGFVDKRCYRRRVGHIALMQACFDSCPARNRSRSIGFSIIDKCQIAAILAEYFGHFTADAATGTYYQSATLWE